MLKITKKTSFDDDTATCIQGAQKMNSNRVVSTKDSKYAYMDPDQKLVDGLYPSQFRLFEAQSVDSSIGTYDMPSSKRTNLKANDMTATR